MDTDRNTHPLVVALYPQDLADLEKLVEVRNASRPAGARKISRSAVVRQLIREALKPAEMTDDEHSR